MKPIGGARVVVTEGEGVVARLRKLEEETTFGKYAKAAQAEMGRARARPVQEKGGRWGWLGWEAGWAGWPLGRLGRKWRKNSFSNKIWFLIIARLWKIVEGDLGGILTWGFFLNSSRHIKDFRKI
jgi:hypothetical protein